MMVGSVIEQSLNDDKQAFNETDRLCCSISTHKPDMEKAIQLSSLITLFVGIIQVRRISHFLFFIFEKNKILKIYNKKNLFFSLFVLR